LQVLEDARAGRDPGPDVCETAARYAVKLAGVTGKGRWVDYVFELYAAVRRPCATEIVDELYEVLRRVKQVSMSALRAYVSVLKEGASLLGPNERFLLSRLEGLERLAALR
jgi:hypothetical protein